MEEDIKILKAFRNYNKFYKEENGKLTITIDLDLKTDLDKAIENLLTRYKRLEEENKNLEEEKEQYKNDYFNLYEQNKQYIHYLKIEELAKKIHNELDKNGITRAYQTIVDGYFDEVLGG